MGLTETTGIQPGGPFAGHSDGWGECGRVIKRLDDSARRGLVFGSPGRRIFSPGDDQQLIAAGKEACRRKAQRGIARLPHRHLPFFVSGRHTWTSFTTHVEYRDFFGTQTQSAGLVRESPVRFWLSTDSKGRYWGERRNSICEVIVQRLFMGPRYEGHQYARRTATLSSLRSAQVAQTIAPWADAELCGMRDG